MTTSYFYLLSVFIGVICTFSSCSKPEEIDIQPAVLLNKTDSLAMLDIYKKTGGGVYWAKTWDLTNYQTWEEMKTEEIGGEYRIVNITILPSAYGSLPESIGKLTELKILYLNGRIAGGLPASIGNLKKLQTLSVVGTILGGKIPKEIGKLQELERLYLINNGMTGELPVELGKLSKLVLINLSHNHFYGKVPLELLDLGIAVALDYNDITELPWECWLNDKYITPTLTFNRLSGKVPENVLATQKWKDLSWLVSDQQKGYGYTE